MGTGQTEVDLLGISPHKSKRGRPRKPDSLERVAALAGMSRRTLGRAKAYLQMVERYPKLANYSMAQGELLAIVKRLEISQWNPIAAQKQKMMVDSLARDIRSLKRKLACMEQMLAKEQGVLRQLCHDAGEDMS
jgi:hypothetical protein